MSQRSRAPPFDKNDKKYEIGSFCCLHVKNVTRILAVAYLAASIFDCIRWMRNYQHEPVIEFSIFIILVLHFGIHILSFVGVVGQSRNALLMLMSAVFAFSIYFLVSQLGNFQANVDYYHSLFANTKISYREVSIFNGAKIILVILLLAYTLMILHYYNSYLADKERNAITPVVVFDRRGDSAISTLPICPAIAAGAAAVAVAAAAGNTWTKEEPKVTDRLVEKEEEIL